jgi:PEP-CTERM motif
MHRRVLLFLAVVLCVPAMAQAALEISTGSYAFDPNTTGNVVTITITSTGGSAYDAGDLRLFINGNVTPAPAVESMFGQSSDADGNPLNISTSATPSVWDPFNLGLGQAGIADGLNATSTAVNVPATGLITIGGFGTTSFTNVTATGTFALLGIDTTGVAPGDYPILLAGGPNGDTDVLLDDANQTVTLTGGNIHINGEIPEPSSILLGLFAAAGFGVVAVRRHRRRRAA